MKTFRILLRDTVGNESIEHVRCFIGEDASGSFGILAHHARFMTRLVFGLARFQQPDVPWQYLAMPGAMLYFNGNELILNTRRYFKSATYTDISRILTETLTGEEQNLLELKHSLHRIEENILRQMLTYESRLSDL
jgi:F-type H+-transporting ATPase subunit epsilon